MLRLNAVLSDLFVDLLFACVQSIHICMRITWPERVWSSGRYRHARVSFPSTLRQRPTITWMMASLLSLGSSRWSVELLQDTLIVSYAVLTTTNVNRGHHRSYNHIFCFDKSSWLITVSTRTVKLKWMACIAGTVVTACTTCILA